MDGPAFFKRFAERQEIGRDITDTQVSVFYDNGSEVGCWREDRRSTVGQGDILIGDDADMARHWYKQVARERQGRSP